MLAGRSDYTGSQCTACVWSTDREPGDHHHGIIPSRGNGVLLECQTSRHLFQWKMQFHVSACLLGDLRYGKRCWSKIEYPVCSTTAELKFFPALPVFGPFLMLITPISPPAESHRMQLTGGNGRLILRFSFCICHGFTPSPSASCLVFRKMRMNI